VEVNGLRLPSPAHAYTTLWEALTGSHASPARAAELLEGYFASSQRTRQVREVDGRAMCVFGAIGDHPCISSIHAWNWWQ